MKMFNANRLRVLPFALLLLLPALSQAYENRSNKGIDHSTARVDSPHGKINELALRLLTASLAHDKTKNQAFDPLWMYTLYNHGNHSARLTGESVATCGYLYPDDNISKHGLLSKVRDLAISRCVMGDKRLTFQDWLIESGYTADEPELWMSLRHFYEPTTQRRLTDEHKYLSAAAFMAGRRLYHTPEMDARTWALSGKAQRQFKANPYSWSAAVENLSKAAACTDPEKRQRLFAAAWRGCGETMHLLADMTVPAHVRDDAHAGLLGAGSLGPDPYECFVTETRIAKIFSNLIGNSTDIHFAAREGVCQSLAKKIDTAAGPPELFHIVSSWTSANFFSADTVSGRLTLDGKTYEIHNANGTADLPSPKIQDCKPEGDTVGLAPMTTYYRKIDMGDALRPRMRKVLMGRLNWATDNGWFGMARTKVQCRGYDVDFDVTMSQAKVLIPLAIYANAKLLDWFIPRLEMRLGELDRDTWQLSGQLLHTPGGAHRKKLLCTMPDSKRAPALYRVYVDGKLQSSSNYHLRLVNNLLTGDLKDLELGADNEVFVDIDFGGIWIRSAPVRSSKVRGVWRLVDHKRTTENAYTPLSEQWESLTSTVGELGKYGISGKLDVKGHFYPEDSPAERKSEPFTLRMSGEVKWDNMPGIIPVGAGWEIPVSGKLDYKISPKEERASEEARRIRNRQRKYQRDYTTISCKVIFDKSSSIVHHWKPPSVPGLVISLDKPLKTTHKLWFPDISHTVRRTSDRTLVVFETSISGADAKETWEYVYVYPPPEDMRSELSQVISDSRYLPRVEKKLNFGAGGIAQTTGEPDKNSSDVKPGQTRLTGLRYVPNPIKMEGSATLKVQLDNAPRQGSYSWSFGDSSFGADKFQAWTEEPKVTHTYLRAGTYTVTVMVRDKRNYSTILDKKQWKVTVRD